MKPSEILARAEQRARQAHSAQVNDWYRITAKAASGGRSSAKVYIYDAIGGWFGVQASEFVREINALDVDEIELHLNSPGGSAFDGVAIYNALRQHDADVTVVVDGLAASAASLIAMAGDSVVMATGSTLMIHDPAGICMGNATDMRQLADVLDKTGSSYAGVYAKKAGGTADSWREVMQAETWYTAEEAVDAGLADRIDDEPADEATAAFDLSIFAHAGRAAAPPPQATHKPPAEPADQPNPTTEGADMTSDTLISGLRERLGIPAEAELDESGLLAALDESLAEQTETNTAATAPPGTVLIDEGTLTELQASAALGRQAHDRQVAADREATIQAAISSGRIPASRAGHWRAQLAADAGAAAVLNGLPENTIPMAPIGYTGGVDEAPDEDSVYAAAWGSTGTEA